MKKFLEISLEKIQMEFLRTYMEEYLEELQKLFLCELLLKGGRGIPARFTEINNARICKVISERILGEMPEEITQEVSE